MDYSGHSQGELGELDDELFSLELDVVTLEYFNHAPFDERIDALLDNCDPSITITEFEAYTPEVVLDREFGFNELIAGEPTTHYTLRSEKTKGKPSQFSISSASGTFDELQFTPTSTGTFSVYNKKTDQLFELSAANTARLVIRSLDKKLGFDDLAQLFGENSPEFHSIIERAWALGAAENGGTITEDYFITGKMHDDIRHREAEVRLGFKRIESSGASEIHLTLEKAFIYEELDTEEAYRLTVKYSNVDTDTQTALNTQEAQRAVRGDGGLKIKGVRLIHTDLGGKKTKLDTSDPEIMQDFIEAFEVLLQQSV